MSNDDLLFRHRQQLFARAGQVGVSQACRELGYHRSTYYRWRGRVAREGLEVLRPRERRMPRMPNQLGPWLEHRVIAFALGHPGFGPRLIAAQLALAEWGGQPVSATGVYKTLRRHGLNTSLKRLSLVAGYAAPPEPEAPPMLPPAHLDVEKPGDLVQFDCFHIGRLTGTKGKVWQYTAIDVSSSFVWAEVHRTELNPSARFTSALARRVADDLAAAGWTLKAAMTDNGSEFKSHEFGNAVRATGAKQRFIHAGRPQTNGCVERVQRTILEECWRPTFARSLVPKYTALRRDLEYYLSYYNWDRGHTGRRSNGQPPAVAVYGSRKMLPR
ncbi:MAG: helix-turn-helix domain-containing protein [Candidatus Dormibacteria bacterium]